MLTRHWAMKIAATPALTTGDGTRGSLWLARGIAGETGRKGRARRQSADKRARSAPAKEAPAAPANAPGS